MGAREPLGPGPSTPPAPGQTAPPAVLVSATGEVVDVLARAREAARGRGTLVVFLPQAFSPVCTGEVRALGSAAGMLAEAGARVLGVTCDAVPVLRAWGRAEAPGLELLSDFWPHGSVTSRWGVLEGATGTPRRSSFLLDRRAQVVWSAHSPPGRARSVADALAAVEHLRRRDAPVPSPS